MSTATKTATPVRYLARCKACALTLSGVATPGRLESPAPFDMVPPGVVHYAARGRTIGMVALICRGCGEPRYAEAVRGKFSPKHKCSAKCLASTRPICECSCAGKNHGAGHQ